MAVPLPPSHRNMTFPPEILTPEEARALIYAPSSRAPTGLRNRALIAVMYGAGLRLAEVLALKPSDVNYHAAQIRVLHGKGDKPRTAIIYDGALGHVGRWADRRREIGLGRSRYLFCTLLGNPISPRYVRAMLARYARRAGIDKRVHPHGLRHTHAAELERSGMTVRNIQDQLGHTSLSTTEVYLKNISPSERAEKIRNLRPEL